MSLSQMEQQTARNVQPVYTATLLMFQPYQGQSIPLQLWYALLQLLFELVQPAAYEQARIARRFYDEERARQLPGAPRQDVDLAGTSFEIFVKEMEEVRPLISKPESTEGDLHKVALRVSRTIEGAGRRTIIKAVEDPDPELDEYIASQEDDDEPDGFFLTDEEIEKALNLNADPKTRRRKKDKPKKVVNIVKGWARVPTGRETCGFCWMLASRGPVYTMEGAGVKGLSFHEALHEHQTRGLTSEDMNQWHTGCDCKAVPVFKLDDWEGMERWKAAEELWYDVTGDVYGKEKMREFRRAIDKGRIQEYLAKHKKAA